MAKSAFSTAQWNKILQLAEQEGEKFGLPTRRTKSVLIGTFNIRKLGKVSARSKQAWDFFQLVLERFDLMAIQEVMDDLDGIRELKNRLGKKYGLVVSDVTGVFPGDSGNAERLAFLFHWPRIERTELASDITYDRSKVVNTLFDEHTAFQQSWEEHIKDLGAWNEKARQSKAAGKKAPTKPTIVLPRFLTFIRQPHCVSFRIVPKKTANAVEFLAVNAHLLFGTNKLERKWEFDSLIEWLTIRAKQAEKMYHRNIILLGDCNLEFESTGIKRDEIDAQLKLINKTKLTGKQSAKVNFPLLTPHPSHGELRTTLRNTETYDQIAIFAHDAALPSPDDNDRAGKSGANSYDYGVFNMGNLFAQALFGVSFAELSSTQQKEIVTKAQHDVSDHMPAWFRLPIPGA